MREEEEGSYESASVCDKVLYLTLRLGGLQNWKYLMFKMKIK